jgi:kynurenine formamidase
MKLIDLSIPLRFDGPQPNAFGVGIATADDLGDTREDSSVNFERYTLVPHCNGTHTECVGHITHKRISVRSCLQDALMNAVLVTIEPVTETVDEYLGALEVGDWLITRDALESALYDIGSSVEIKPPADAGGTALALIVRTLPNSDEKLIADYGDENISPYFTNDAMRLIVERGFEHLLVDMPSIDRLYDGGHLSNHRIFWNIRPGSFETDENTRVGSTVTEMIYAPDEVADGNYLLNLQIAPFESDCAPRRPVLLMPDHDSRQ